MKQWLNIGVTLFQELHLGVLPLCGQHIKHVVFIRTAVLVEPLMLRVIFEESLHVASEGRLHVQHEVRRRPKSR